MQFLLLPVVLALALVACKSPVKLDSATVEDRQAAASAAAEKSPTPILGNSLLKDAANSARNVAALDLSAKDANARAVGSAGVSGQAAADAASAAAAAKLAATQIGRTAKNCLLHEMSLMKSKSARHFGRLQASAFGDLDAPPFRPATLVGMIGGFEIGGACPIEAAQQKCHRRL
eukprot:gene58864-78544_t